ncbi:hypothetical protein G5V65_15875 [Rhodobacter sp. HX-7-19]|uniref:Uncharacterized protein n=1 Tax=Paragemmobacter kunshanensis TaxID=2583234 RepID=A0A6M1U0C6_9RHOB|nr:hypothetical protein [Rhodobacter kunshanensis]NGQ92376.1 hypothetical protein [Rhodobacter kunshanensis]
MQLGLALLEKLGLFAHKSAHVDPHFDLRLQRIGAREMLRERQAGAIPVTGENSLRNPPEHRAV